MASNASASIDWRLVAQRIDDISATTTLDDGLRSLLTGVASVTHAHRAGLLLHPSLGHLAPSRAYWWLGGERFAWLDVREFDHTAIAGQALADRPVVTLDHAVTSYPVLIDMWRRYGVRSSLIVPLRARGEIIANLIAASEQPYALDETYLPPIILFASHGAQVVERTRTQHELEQRRRADAAAYLCQLESLQHIGAVVNAASDLDGLLDALLAELLPLVAGERGIVWLLDPDDRLLRGRVGRNVPPSAIEAAVLPVPPAPDANEPEAVRVVRTGEPLVITDSGASATPFAPDAACRAYIPIAHTGKPVGVLDLLWIRDHLPGADDVLMLRLVAQNVGGAVARARLLDELERQVAQTRQAREELSAALHVSAAVIYSYDQHGRVVQLEGDAEPIFGWPAHEVIGRDLRDFLPETMSQRAQTRIAERAAGDRSVRHYHGEVVHRSGRRVPIIATVRPRLQGDAVVGGAGAIIDISLFTQLEAERDAARAAQARAEGAMHTGRAVVHELGSPLASVLGLAELLGDDPGLSAEARQDIETLLQEARRAADLLKQFGRIARYEEMPTPFGPQLDVDRAAEQRER